MFRLFDLVSFVFERLWQHRLLVFWTLVGLTAATTLALSIALYVDAVNTNLLTDSLDEPPYAFRFRYLGSWEGNITQADVASASAVLHTRFVDLIGLPTAQEARFISSGRWTVQRQEDTLGLGAFPLGTLEGMNAHIEITSGTWPAESTPGAEVIPVLASEKVLFQMGLQVGDRLTASRAGVQPVTLEIAALWAPINATDPSWFLPSKFFDEVFLMQPTDFWDVMAPVENPVEEVDWQIVFDGRTLRTSDVGALLNRITDGRREVFAALPGIRLDISPEEGLRAFNAQVRRLTQQLIIVVMPVGGLILYFVTALAEMLVGRQQTEDVTLSSRGMSRARLLFVHGMMWLSLAAAALVMGIIFAVPVVQLIGQTSSFLRFDAGIAPLTVVFTRQAILTGAATGLLASSSGLWMAWRTAGKSITSFKQGQARGRKAWWQRVYLDVMLLVPALYVFYTLQAGGGLVAEATEPFDDPLVFLAPTLFSLGFTLLFLRVYPFFLNIAARLVAITSSVALLMALRELTRSMGRYRGALLMMCFTLSLIGFTASMASTLDRSLEDVINYQIGADSVLNTAAEAQTEDASDGTLTVTGYNTLPVTTLYEVEGISQVSRVGRYPTQLILPSQRLSGTILGIDRAPMVEIARFRDDYAAEPLADLLNRLAGNRNGLLMNSETAEAYGLIIGQEVTLQIQALNATYQTTAPIIGLVDYFPTLDPREGFFAITTIDPLFELVGTELPHDAWISLKSGADLEAVQAGVAELGFPLLRWLDPQTSIESARADASRRGVLGFLSVGFIAAILLTLVGSVIQSAASFRAQAIQIGALRAMGMGSGSVGAYLIFSQGFAALGGVAGGTCIGMATTLLFLPLLDFSGGLPPYLVRVAWGDIVLVYAIFAGILLCVTLLTTAFLGRERAATLIKLGDV